jgi:outer membrane protein assembly factor BamB
VRVNIDEEQWDEAIEGLRQLMENYGDRLVRLDSQRFVSLRQFAHLRLADLPADGIALYRGRVDPQAKRWYDEGLKSRSPRMLSRVVDELFVSSYGDDALRALGEIALERGDYMHARECWERISPELRSADGLPLMAAQRSADERQLDDPPASALESGAAAWLAYPDTDLNLADVRARLILVSLLEGAPERAEIEYKRFVELHADTTGLLAGRDGLYRETLEALIKRAKNWPPSPAPLVATTFGGTPTRNFVQPGQFALRSLAWNQPIPFAMTAQANVKLSSHDNPLPNRPAESRDALLSYHPLVAGNLVIFHDSYGVYVFDLTTGKPAWEHGEQARPGLVYPRERDRDNAPKPNTVGVPRFITTVHGDYLFVRLGSQSTSWPETSPPNKPGSLVVLDLAQQGKLIAELQPDSERWSFEGPPVCDGSRFFIAMRYNDVRPQSHVACYELAAATGAAGTVYDARLRWRRLICSAESPARGMEEITHNLLTLAEGSLYLNTNLGAVARLSAEDGRIDWIHTYPRAKTSQNPAHFYRDLNPCVYYRGTLYVAPTDSPQIFAIDAASGLLRWASAPALSDVVHLLGVAEGSLIASGKQLWWLDAQTGKKVMQFPDSKEAMGYGRGMLMGDVVVWPTRQELYVFLQKQSPSRDANAKPAMPRDPIRLADYVANLSGGNLSAAGDYVLLATPDKLWAFGPNTSETQLLRAK